MSETGERIVVEYGPGDVPFTRWLKKDYQGDRTVLVEKDPETVEWLKKNILKPEDKIVVATAQDETLASDLIFVKDMFGRQSHGETREEDMIGKKLVGNVEEIAKRWFANCKPGGKVMIVETYIPYPREELIKYFTQSGFIVEKQIEKADLSKELIGDLLPDNSNKEAFVVGNAVLNEGAANSYALILQKPI